MGEIKAGVFNVASLRSLVLADNEIHTIHPDALKGVRLFAGRDVLPDLPDDEFYHADLIGLAVFDTGGTQLGTVRAVHDHGAGDLLEIHGPNLKATVLLPFTRAVIPTVDVKGGRIVADPPDGLF